MVKVNTFGRNSDVRLDWGGVRKLSELEVETWFEDTRRVRKTFSFFFPRNSDTIPPNSPECHAAKAYKKAPDT